MVVPIANFQSCITNTPFTIAISQPNSTAIQLNGLLPVGLRFPAAMTGSTVTLEESVDGTNWSPIRINGDAADFSVTVTASKTVVFANAIPLAGFEYLRIVSSSNEAAERSVGLICRPI